MAEYAVGVRWSGGPLDKMQMQWSGVAGAHVVSAGRCCYTAEESPCRIVPLKVCT